MTVGLSVGVVLAVLCSSCLGLPFAPQPGDEQRSISVPSEALFEVDSGALGESRVRQSRSSPQLKAAAPAEDGGDSRANLSELLARLISSRKGSVRRNSMSQNRSGKKRISDRDYVGWMDFGRRSAEEYEYSS